MEQTITIQGLCKSYGNKEILKDVSFEARPGRITAFLGPNGAGKSTTMRILLGLDRATSGKALIGGKKYSEWKDPITKTGASFDGVGAPNDRTVRQHLKIIALSNGIDTSRAEEVMNLTDIAHKASSRIGSLSLGEGQRVGIAAALLGDPDFMIFDEPTNGLDPIGIKWFRYFLREQADKGKTVLLSSHILSEVEAVADDVVIIDHGAVKAKGTLDEVKKDLSSLEEIFFNIAGEEAAL